MGGIDEESNPQLRNARQVSFLQLLKVDVIVQIKSLCDRLINIRPGDPISPIAEE